MSPGKPENGYRCHCVCPPTHRGEHCEERISSDYYESMNITLCGGQINRSDQIIEQAVNSTPCTWTIKAPENQFIQIEFEHFALRQRFKSKLNHSAVNNRCLYESLGECHLGRANCSKWEHLRKPEIASPPLAFLFPDELTCRHGVGCVLFNSIQ